MLIAFQLRTVRAPRTYDERMPPPSDELCHVLIVNQHGDNRGDEAAMTAVFDALADRLGPVRFTVLHQFNDPAASSNPGGHDVRFVPLLPRGSGSRRSWRRSRSAWCTFPGAAWPGRSAAR